MRAAFASITAILLLGLALCGCELFSEPICDEEQSVVDPRLLGRWEIPVTEVDGDGVTEMSLTISPAEGGRSLTIVSSDVVNGVRTDSTVVARGLQIAGRGFVSLHDPDPKAKLAGWYLFQYRVVAEDEIHVYLINDSQFVPAVRSGKLPGRVAVTPLNPLTTLLGVTPSEEVVQLDATPQQLRDYLQTHPDDLFDLREPIYVLKRSLSPADKKRTSQASRPTTTPASTAPGPPIPVPASAPVPASVPAAKPKAPAVEPKPPVAAAEPEPKQPPRSRRRPRAERLQRALERMSRESTD